MDRVEPLITATSAEIAALGALCHASKGYWGYPAKWMALWAEELSVSHDAALRGDLAVVRDGTGFSAVAQLSCYQDQAELEKLFVAPHSIGRGLGRLLLNWAKTEAARRGAGHMRIVSDPHAVGFYQAQGARLVGQWPSSVIKGRSLAVLSLSL